MPAGFTPTTSPTRPRSTSSPSTTVPVRTARSSAAVLAGEADGVGAVRVDQADQFAAHLAGEHHADHVHGLRGGDPQAALELGFDAEPAQHGS